MNIQIEKYELENILERISRQTEALPPVADQIDIIEHNLRVLHKTYEINFQEENEAGLYYKSNFYFKNMLILREKRNIICR